MNEYSVSVSNIFQANSPEDAATQMAYWLLEYADKAGYRVEGENKSWFVDVEGIRVCDNCGRATDAGEYPDWVNGECEICDPSILDAPENKERMGQ